MMTTALILTVLLLVAITTHAGTVTEFDEGACKAVAAAWKE